MEHIDEHRHWACTWHIFGGVVFFFVSCFWTIRSLLLFRIHVYSLELQLTLANTLLEFCSLTCPPGRRKCFIADNHFNGSQDNMSDLKRWEKIRGTILWEFALRAIPWCQLKEQIFFEYRETQSAAKYKTALWRTEPPDKTYHAICNSLAGKVFFWPI